MSTNVIRGIFTILEDEGPDEHGWTAVQITDGRRAKGTAHVLLYVSPRDIGGLQATAVVEFSKPGTRPDDELVVNGIHVAGTAWLHHGVTDVALTETGSGSWWSGGQMYTRRLPSEGDPTGYDKPVTDAASRLMYSTARDIVAAYATPQRVAQAVLKHYADAEKSARSAVDEAMRALSAAQREHDRVAGLVADLPQQ